MKQIIENKSFYNLILDRMQLIPTESLWILMALVQVTHFIIEPYKYKK